MTTEEIEKFFDNFNKNWQSHEYSENQLPFKGYFCADCNTEISLYQYENSGLCLSCGYKRRLKFY